MVEFMLEVVITILQFALSSIEVYDPSTQTKWTNAGNFPENKYAADAVVLNNKVYVIAGKEMVRLTPTKYSPPT